MNHTTENRILKITMKNTVLFSLLLFPYYSLFAQEAISSKTLLSEARKDIVMLCSGKFAGRGYVNEGHKKAAEYIARRFSQIGLKPVNEGENPYFQYFTLNLNIIRDASVSIDGQSMQMGKDFILSPASPASSGTQTLEDAGYGLTRDGLPMGCALLFMDGLPPEIANDPAQKEKYKEYASLNGKISVLEPLNPELLVVRKKKLTASFSAEQGDFPVVECVEDSLPEAPSQIKWQTLAATENIETQNVIGKITGTIKDTFIVISAHYDHLGQVGEAVFTGANDNASGIALLLSLAEHFAKNPPKYSLLFIAFGAEETGLIGSKYYVEKDPIIPLKKMRFMLNLDLMGNGTEGIMAVGGVENTKEFELLTQLNQTSQAVPIVKSRKNAPNSDHYFFLLNGVKGFFIYTMGGPQWYHDVFDTPENLELSKYPELRNLFIQFIGGL